jgi:hypothetical protein
MQQVRCRAILLAVEHVLTLHLISCRRHRRRRRRCCCCCYCCCCCCCCWLLVVTTVFARGLRATAAASAGEFNDPAWVASLLSQLGGVDMTDPAIKVGIAAPPVVLTLPSASSASARALAVVGAAASLRVGLSLVVLHRPPWTPSLEARRRTATAAAAAAVAALVTRSRHNTMQDVSQ